MQVGADRARSASLEGVARLADRRSRLTLGRVSLGKQCRKVAYGSRRRFLAGLLAFFGRNLKTRLLRLVLLKGDIDERFCAENEQQSAEHGHGDLVQAVMLHGRPSPRMQRLLFEVLATDFLEWFNAFLTPRLSLRKPWKPSALHIMACQPLAPYRMHPYILMYGIREGAMPKVELSDRFISSLKPQEIAADFFDAKTTGLNLRVTPTGVKAWSVMFTSPKDGRRARLSLGTYPATSLAKARTHAIEARGHVEAGTDPRDLGKPSTGPMTVAMLAEDYIEKHGRTLRDGTREEIVRKMRMDVVPIIGNMQIDPFGAGLLFLPIRP